MANAVNTEDAVTKDGGKPTVVGNPDNWQLLSKFVSSDKTIAKSTKAMSLGHGCLVQVTTKEGNAVAEALAYVPGVVVVEDVNGGRRLAPQLDYAALAYGFHILDSVNKTFLSEEQEQRVNAAYVVAQAILPRWGKNNE